MRVIRVLNRRNHGSERLNIIFIIDVHLHHLSYIFILWYLIVYHRCSSLHSYASAP
ncbi:hypothetical protein HanXRQr2_Chr05g0225191 [Helianthus annuus]|uniref:Uncharacterized protein n=1 Tax=Helianthus annuus TaxID=4232 RepID=A0A251UU29_HELAN|nr:hypothetical protein HanXRQr2_Chr05g0225191 [Helianthus annuus]